MHKATHGTSRAHDQIFQALSLFFYMGRSLGTRLVVPELHENDHCCITCVTSGTVATKPYPVAEVHSLAHGPSLAPVWGRNTCVQISTLGRVIWYVHMYTCMHVQYACICMQLGSPFTSFKHAMRKLSWFAFTCIAWAINEPNLFITRCHPLCMYKPPYSLSSQTQPPPALITFSITHGEGRV